MPLASYGAIRQKEGWTPMASYGGERVNVSRSGIVNIKFLMYRLASQHLFVMFIHT